MYGYKVNRVKKPNLHTRRHWNFIQTINSNIIREVKFFVDNFYSHFITINRLLAIM